MYRNKAKISSGMIVSLVASIPLFVIALIMDLYAIALYVGWAEPDEPTDYGMSIIMAFLFTVPFVILWKRVIRAIRANKLGKFFENYQDGLVPIEEAATFMKMKQRKVVSVFLDCLGKAYIKNCSIFADDPTFIILENGAKTIQEKYVITHCKQCSAPNAIRIGFENACKYCGMPIVWKN